MNLDFITENISPLIVLACLIVGWLIKNTNLFRLISNNNIPLIVALLGAVLGGVDAGFTLDAIVYGAVSGLVSTGLHQLFTRFIDNFGGSENLAKKEGSETMDAQYDLREDDK